MILFTRDNAQTEGIVAKTGRCLSKAACHAEAEKINFAVNIKLAKNAEKPGDDQFVLSGTGPVAEYQGHGLGLYTYDKDLLYYEQQGGDYYLVKDRAGWFTFPRISGCKKTGYSCIAQYVANLKARNLTGEPWYFAKSKTWTKDDHGLIQFLPLNSNSCLMFKTIFLHSDGPAKSARPDYFGRFDRTPKFSAGRPVYRNKQGKFLMMKNEFTTFSVWDEAESRLSAGKGDEGTRGVRSVSGPTCVTDLEDGWQFQNKAGEWVEDGSITVNYSK